MISLAQKIVDNIDINQLKTVDAWTWAKENALKLVGGNLFDFRGHEYQIQPMQEDVEMQVAKKATQMGWTELYVLRCLHSLIFKLYPKGILYLFPTKDTVTDFSASRFLPLIKDNHDIVGQFIKETDRANLKRIHNSFIYFRSGKLGQVIENQAKVSAGLFSIPVDAVIFDEWDLMDQKAREPALERMADSNFKHQVYLSNPSIPDYGIDKLYQKSDQKIWLIPCQHCSECTCLETEFPNSLQRQQNGTVIRACKKCGKEIYPRDGFWEPQYANRDISGYWISHLNNLKVDPKEMLDKWEDPDLDREQFYRLKLGIAYVEASERLQKNDLYACLSSDLMWGAHKGPCAMGIDVGKFFHVTILDRPRTGGVRAVFIGKFTKFEDIHDIAQKFNIECCVIDKFPETRAARKFGEAEPYRTYLCTYTEEMRGLNHFDDHLYEVKVNRNEILDKTHEIVITAGQFTLPRINENVEEFIVQMTNMAKIKEEDKRTGVIKYRYVALDQDHYRHSLNYALLATSKIGLSKEGSEYQGAPFKSRPRNWMLR